LTDIAFSPRKHYSQFAHRLEHRVLNISKYLIERRGSNPVFG